jgi:hypothetical protein
MYKSKEQLFRSIFSPPTLKSLSRIHRPVPSKWDDGGNPQRQRHLVAAARGPLPSEWRWARRAAWVEHLWVAHKCGLLDADTVARLQGTDDEKFRGVMAECFVAWFFADRRKAKVVAKPEKVTERNVDLSIKRDDLEVFAEVKAPYVPKFSPMIAGDDRMVLRRAVGKAATQMKKGRANVVVLVPTLRTPVFMDREQLESVFVSLGDGRAPPPPKNSFRQNGKLAKLLPGPDETLVTHLTRVSAVMTLELSRDNHSLQPRATVIHNPFAEVPIPRGFFGRVPQLVKLKDGNLRWTDSRRNKSDPQFR